VQRGNDRETCFVEDGDFSEYLARLRAASEKFDVAIHAYVLMSNHVHILATPVAPEGVGRMMQAVGSGYVPGFNARHGRTGTLWDGRYFSSLVGADSYFWNCQRYIELNPVRAGIVRDPLDYKWSSHARNAFGRSDPIVTPHPAYLALGGESASVYRQFFQEDLSEATISQIRETLAREGAFGNDSFLDQVESVASRSPKARPRGRPRKAAENRSDLFSSRG
jgi:putative transposase